MRIPEWTREFTGIEYTRDLNKSVSHEQRIKPCDAVSASKDTSISVHVVNEVVESGVIKSTVGPESECSEIRGNQNFLDCSQFRGTCVLGPVTGWGRVYPAWAEYIRSEKADGSDGSYRCQSKTSQMARQNSPHGVISWRVARYLRRCLDHQDIWYSPDDSH